MKNKMTVVLLEPSKCARVAVIDSSLESIQKTVGGFIEVAYPFEEDVCIVCNEEEKIHSLELNRALYTGNREVIYDIIAGSAFICSCAGEELESLSEEQLKKYSDMFYYPEIFIRINDKIQALAYAPPGESVASSTKEKKNNPFY